LKDVTCVYEHFIDVYTRFGFRRHSGSLPAFPASYNYARHILQHLLSKIAFGKSENKSKHQQAKINGKKFIYKIANGYSLKKHFIPSFIITLKLPGIYRAR